jgi:glucose-6-phosphate isomerase
VALGGTAYQEPEASLYLPHDVAMVKETKQTLDTMGVEAVEYVFLVGIGGSNLGAMAVANALQGRLVRSDEPQLVNLDTISAADIDVLQQEVRQQLRPEQYIIFVVSKSGGTTETMANAELLLAEVFPSIETAKQRVVVITDSGSALDQAAKRQSLARLHLPKAVGGRYSVFSPVGMAPLYAMGVDIDALLQGARDIQPYAWQTDITHNPAIQLAGAVASYHECGYTVYDTFCFTPELETLGKWGRQLIGESIGKTRVTNDQTEYVGMVPTVSVGSTDLHSVGQLYLGGRKTVFTNFLSVAEPTYETVVPTNAFFADTVPMVLGQTTTTINEAILSGTMQAYCEADRPFIQTELAAITPYELGAYMQCKMMELMYLGALLRINPFDQPQVELYKTHTKDKLAH